jgi:DNA/RNA-binding domain of Phe-tRNA-synthetase-like protein
MIEIGIAGDFRKAGIEVTLGCLVAEVDPGAGGEGLNAALAHEEERVSALLKEKAPADIPAVAATRSAYKALGKDPSRYRPAAEALLRRIAQGKGLYRINAVVDASNLVSIATGFSIGAYDLETIAPPVLFRVGKAGESYEGIGKGPLNLESLPLFADARGPFGSPTSDSERTMIKSGTRRLLMILIGFAPTPVLPDRLELATQALRAHAGACGIEASIARG